MNTDTELEPEAAMDAAWDAYCACNRHDDEGMTAARNVYLAAYAAYLAKARP